MAKAKLPKLEWVKDGSRDFYIAGPFTVMKSYGHRGLWLVDRGARYLGYGRTSTEAKAIAQAFADSETLRGEGG